MTRSKSKPTANLKVKSACTNKVFLFNKSDQLSENSNKLFFQTVKLPRKISLFAFSNSGSQFFEVLNFNENNRSWFLNEAVCSNGKIYFLNKIDPIFLFIQFLEAHCKEKAKPIDQVFEDRAAQFLKYFDKKQMQLVADQKGPDDLNAFKYNEEKVLKWLQRKFEILHKILKEKNIVHAGATSSNFVKSEKICDVEVDDDTIKETTLGILSEYISMDLMEKLEKIYNINQNSGSQQVKRKSENLESPANTKKIKIEKQESSESPDKDSNVENFNLNTSLTKSETALPKQTAKDKALTKAAKGTKSIASFFSKK